MGFVTSKKRVGGVSLRGCCWDSERSSSSLKRLFLWKRLAVEKRGL